MARFVWLYLLLSAGPTLAQPAVAWLDTLHMSPYLHCAIQTDNGGFLIGGDDDSSRSGAWLIGLGDNGDMQNARWYPGAACLRSVVPTADNYYLWAAYWGLTLIKADSHGDTLWTRRWQRPGGPQGLRHVWVNLQPTPDGHFVLAGGVQAQRWLGFLMKVSADGDSLWYRQYPELPTDSLRAIPLADGFLFYGGIGGENTGLLAWADSDGEVVSTRSYEAEEVGEFRTALPAEDDGYYLMTGQAVVRVDANGELQWHYPVPRTPNDWCNQLQRVNDGVVLMCTSWSPPSMRMIHFTTDGTVLWDERFTQWYGMPFESSITVTADQGYLCVMQPHQLWDRSLIVRLGPDTARAAIAVDPPLLHYGEVEPGSQTTRPLTVSNAGSARLHLTEFRLPEALAVELTLPLTLEPGTDTTLAVTFSSETAGAYLGTIWLNGNVPGGPVAVPAEANVLQASLEPGLPTRFHLYAPSPNPFNPATVIAFDLPQAGPVSLRVYDLLGRAVTALATGPYPAGRHRVVFDGAPLPSGLYLCRLEAGAVQATERLLLLK